MLNFLRVNLLLESVAFLGHIVSSDGIRVKAQKIEALQSWPRPISPIDIKSFLYFAGCKLRAKEVASVKVLWRNQFVKKATWEAKEDINKRYPYLFESGEILNQGFGEELKKRERGEKEERSRFLANKGFVSPNRGWV
ncbi:hypothetical protein MTR67_001510 [Solanum verrucosum]|uniref:Uncharacterized protein n=1 Tax=Solanum verrucosum TaxID=315347 RepID=A0AAF0TCG8_SOLVR|nr:hypothetical protein MTR67_001510 [Solanum verrucosum]